MGQATIIKQHPPDRPTCFHPCSPHLLLTRHLEWSFSNVHHITSLSCSRPSRSSHLTPRKGKLLTTPYCPSNLISCRSLLSPSLPPSRHNDRLALPQTYLTYNLPQGLCTCWYPQAGKPYSSNFTQLTITSLKSQTSITSSERPCQLAPRPLTLLYFSSEHLLLSEVN